MAILTFQLLVFGSVPVNYIFASEIWYMINFESVLNCETCEWVGLFKVFAALVVLDIAWLVKFSRFYYGFPMDYLIVLYVIAIYHTQES